MLRVNRTLPYSKIGGTLFYDANAIDTVLAQGIHTNKKYRYFTQRDIDTCLLRQEIAARSQTALNLRNNVEASIFQLDYHYPNDKSRYRGIVKHEMWANIRCLWLNFVRIVHFVARSGSKCVQKAENRGSFPGFYSVFAEMYGITVQFCHCKGNELIIHFKRIEDKNVLSQCTVIENKNLIIFQKR